VALGRINASDSSNNGLLMRNLFGSWPRKNLAQIYSSGGNGDDGCFGHYYQLGSCDRVFGSLFYKIKESSTVEVPTITSINANIVIPTGLIPQLKQFSRSIFMDTGIYELLFRPRLSAEMDRWVKEFQPDVIFAQGYNLTFTWLPLLLKKATCAKLAFLCSDDWPTYLYSGQLGEPTLFRWIVRTVVKTATDRLFSEVDVPFAFGQAMAEEYASRYGKKFFTLNHADNSRRFDSATPHRIHPPDVKTIISIGNYNRFRWPLLLDANDACQELNAKGIKIRLVVLSSSIEVEGLNALSAAKFIDVFPDPGNDLLPSYLRGADILLLAEGFDEGFVSAIKLSVSSKAHLFMFSHRPIIVYAHPDTGIAKYAKSSDWGRLVIHRNKRELVEAIRGIIENQKETECLIAHADEVAEKYHSYQANNEIMLRGLAPSRFDRGERDDR
jgi:glycosyltransferase involved in cell wall biosynthesis